jgi:hypothetical protein
VRDALALIFMVREDRRSWLPAAVWGAVGLISLAVAVWVAGQPERLADLRQVRTWLAFVEQHSADPYVYFDSQLDYPPLAFLVLWPLGWIPEDALLEWFVPAGIAVTAAAGWVFARVVAERLKIALTLSQQIAIVGLMLSGSSARGSIWRGQTVALAILLGALALLWSRRRPFAAALALALCSFKPHLAVGFGLAILLIDGADVLMVAAAIVVSLSILVAAAMDQSVLAIAATYAHNLFAMYGASGHIDGLLSIRWVFEDAVGHYGAATLVYAAAGTGSLVMLGLIARRMQDDASRTHVVAIALLWPLLFLPSQLYAGFMAAPAIWLLMWPESGAIRRESRRIACVAAVVAFTVFDIPRTLRFLSAYLDDGHWLYKGSYYLSPLRIVLLFAFLLSVANRRTRAQPDFR